VKVVLVSEFEPGREVSLAACYARAFERTGHDLTRVALRPQGRLENGLWSFATAGLRARARQAEIRDQVLACSPDVVVLVGAGGVLANSVESWRGAGLRVVNVVPNNPFDGIGASGGGRLLEQLRACDRVFLHDRFVVGQLRQLGVPSAFIAFARDPTLHAPSYRGGGLSPPSQIVFVGNLDPERIRFLRAIADLGLSIWGQRERVGLSADDPLARCVRGREQVGHDLARCIGASLLSVNLLRPSQRTGHNMRTFESPACRACTLSEASNGVLELMEDGVEVVTFSTPDELRLAAISLLENTPRIESIAEAGWARVAEETYDVRVRQVLESLA
jgi:hypothetical protein